MIYQIGHVTEYTLSDNVAISHHVCHLTPRAHPRQICLRTGVTFEPAPASRSDGIDYYGNPTVHVTVQEPYRTLRIEAQSTVQVLPRPALDLEASLPWEEVRALVESARDSTTLQACEFAYASPYVVGDDATFELSAACFPPGRPLLAGVAELTERIFDQLTYEGGVTDISTPVAEVLALGKGVCQDFAHLQIAGLRMLGLPARYVSGYLRTHPPEGQPRLVGADASHAWVSVWCPPAGWVDFDPTNNVLPDQEHITLACGRDYGDVSPINGSMVGGGAHTVNVAVDVQVAG